MAKAQGSDEHPIGDLDAARTRELLQQRGIDWPAPVILESTGSTNADLEALAREGAPEGTSVVADQQTAGRGRLDRTWVSPPGAGLWFSILVRPGPRSARSGPGGGETGDVPADRLGWLPLLAGLAATDALMDACSVRAELKWPNDLVAIAAACGGSEGPRKLGGILSAVVPDAGGQGDAVVIGIGINVNMGSADLPVKQATSVLLEGGRLDRGQLLVTLLVALHERLQQWRSGDDAVAHDYRARCATIGRRVDVAMPSGTTVTGIVSGVDDDGHLLVSDGEATARITAGDVIHATI